MKDNSVEEQSPLHRRLRNHRTQQNSLGRNCEESHHNKSAYFRKLNINILVQINADFRDKRYEA